MRWTAGRPFAKQDMDLHYEQDLTNYPDVFHVYGENYEKYEKLKKQYENEDYQGVITPDQPRSPNPSERPGAMRAWLNKWDPEFNTEFKQVGTQSDNANN